MLSRFTALGTSPPFFSSQGVGTELVGRRENFLGLQMTKHTGVWILWATPASSN